MDDLFDQGFLVVPAGGEGGEFRFKVGDAGLDFGQTRGLVGGPGGGQVAAERGLLALQGGDAGRQAFKLGRLAAAADAHPGRGGVQHVNGLVGQLSARHIARR